MPHHLGHLSTSVAALAATLLMISVTPNALVKRKLRLSVFLFAVYVILHLVLFVRPQVVPLTLDHDLRSLEQLALAAGFINLLVVGVINPLRSDRVPDAFPAILQDAIVIGVVALVATFVFDDKLLTTSAVGAAIVGFALQDTLGNAFAGLAIQSEKPFRVGAWIKVADFEGRVSEVTWRATKLRTKSGNFVIVPNNIVAKEAIINYSEPLVPTRIEVEVGASYLSTPGDVKRAILEAIGNVPRVLKSPAPNALLHAFDGSAITYRARFWIDTYETDEIARDEVRTAIFYCFARHGIEIPWPIEVGYQREWPEPDEAAKLRQRDAVLARVDLFARLSEPQRLELAQATALRIFGEGEPIVRQGEAGDSMFVIASGRVEVVIEPERHRVAGIETGGYFGEMSLLSGEPRTATVLARGDTTVLELDAHVFRRLGAVDPHAVEQVAMAAVTRRIELDQARDTARPTAAPEATATLLGRMRRFLGIG
ncbi:MAG: mechanosensitive ion channel family protein [Vicinamibacterales bacterium]